jgi:hypothetical protein
MPGNKHEIIPYSEALPLLRIGDKIASRGSGLVATPIIKIGGGEEKWSHIATVIRDVYNEGTGRVDLSEALLIGGVQRNYLNPEYEKAHGILFWIPMQYNTAQQYKVMELAATVRGNKTGYDFKSTLRAWRKMIPLNPDEFNCSELCYYYDVEVKRVVCRKNKKGQKIAPKPGNYPKWVAAKKIFQFDMSC